ncbi:MAG: hypothetical protein AAGF95_25435 [Chloroflexota bacterium]
MAVRSQEIRKANADGGAIRSRPLTVAPSITLHSLAYLVTALLALLAVYGVMGNVISWGTSKFDDFRYGNPRTYQLSAVVGHNDSPEHPTHLIAMNLNQQVVVLQLPGGDPAQVRTLTGPYLFGSAEEKTPVLMRLEDLNRDGTPDLVVSAKNEEIVYLNRDSEFQLITPEERAQLIGMQ